MKTRSSLLAGAAFAALSFLAGCGAPPPPHGALYVRVGPPRPPVEIVTVRPSVEHVWIAGHYVWTGADYRWEPGHWELRPHRRAKWVTGHWYHGRGGWYWVEGRWR